MKAVVKIGRMRHFKDDIICPYNGFTECRLDDCAKYMTAWYYCQYVCESRDSQYCDCECNIRAYKDEDNIGFCTL